MDAGKLGFQPDQTAGSEILQALQGLGNVVKSSSNFHNFKSHTFALILTEYGG